MDELLCSFATVGSGLTAVGSACAAATSRWLTTDRIVVVCIPLAALAAILLLNAWDKRAARRMKAAALAARPRPEWAVSLLVDADEKAGVLRPIVQVLGPPLPGDITVRLQVGGAGDDVRLGSERRFCAAATKTDLVLGALAVPDGVSVAEVALWDWEVVLYDDRRQIARRSGPLTAAGRVNEEGELETADLEAAPVEVEPAPELPDPVRSWGWTIGLSGAVVGVALGGYLLTTLSAWLWFACAPLIGFAAMLEVSAALLLCTTCPVCRHSTTVLGRTGTQRCDACGGNFTLTPLRTGG